MRQLIGGAVLTVAVLTTACGGGPPQRSAPEAASAPGNLEELRALEAQQQTAPKEAVAGLDAYVAKYPADPRGHWQLASAIADTVPLFPSDYTDADRAALDRAAQHERKVVELAGGSLREAAYMGLLRVYGPLMLARPEELIEPARQLIAMSATLANAHYVLADALADLTRTDEAVQVWTDAARTLHGLNRREIAAGIDLFAESHPELTEAHIATLVSVLTTVAADVENPDPRATAVALTLRANSLEKDPARKQALLQQAAPWKALADEASQKSMDELNAMIEDLRRRAAARRD